MTRIAAQNYKSTLFFIYSYLDRVAFNQQGWSSF